MTLEQAIDRLEDLGEVETGRGPLHPADPRPELASDIAGFLDEYPRLRADASYVEFLQRYSGLVMTRDEDFLSLSILGFDDEVALHMTEGGGDVTTNGFLTFALASVPLEEGAYSEDDPQGLAYAFDVSGARRPGVYRDADERSFTWYVPDFRTWLERLVALEGRWAERDA